MAFKREYKKKAKGDAMKASRVVRVGSGDFILDNSKDAGFIAGQSNA